MLFAGVGGDSYGGQLRLWPDYSVLYAMPRGLEFYPTDRSCFEAIGERGEKYNFPN